MEFGPILRALSRHKTGALLAALQIAVSLAVMVNAAFIIQARIEKMDRPTGMDIGNLVTVEIRSFGADRDALGDIRRDLEMIRARPEVRSATMINQFPLSGSGSATGMRTTPQDEATPILTARYEVDEHGLETLGVNVVRGRGFRPEEVQLRIPNETEPESARVVVVTQALADELFPDTDALGATIYWADLAPATIIGIIDHMQGSWVGWDKLDSNMLQPRLSAWESVRYLIRTKPGQRDALIRVLEDELTALDRNRVVRNVRAHEDLVARSYETDRATTQMLSAVIVLLVGLTALVIVGLASYFVSQRTRQIGTRRALGATKADIVRYFLVENWLITTFGAALGCVLTVAVGYWLETAFDLPRLDWRYLGVAVTGLWIVSLAAALWPSLRASRVAPAVATRTV